MSHCPKSRGEINYHLDRIQCFPQTDHSSLLKIRSWRMQQARLDFYTMLRSPKSSFRLSKSGEQLPSRFHLRTARPALSPLLRVAKIISMLPASPPHTATRLAKLSTGNTKIKSASTILVPWFESPSFCNSMLGVLLSPLERSHNLLG